MVKGVNGCFYWKTSAIARLMDFTMMTFSAFHSIGINEKIKMKILARICSIFKVNSTITAANNATSSKIL